MNKLRRYIVKKKGWVWLVEEKGLMIRVIKTIKAGEKVEGYVQRHKPNRRKHKVLR